MNEIAELFSEVEEEFDDDMDDWEMPDPDPEMDDWAETWLDGLDDDDVDGYDSDFWED